MDKDKYWYLRKAPSTIFGLLIIGVVINSIYDLLIRPGLNSFGRGFLQIVTLGSESLRDSAYASAALDPTPVTPLLLLFSALYFFVGTFLGTVTFRPIFKFIRAKLGISDNSGEIDEEKKRAIRARIRKLRFVSGTLLIVSILPVFVAFSVHNQAVLIWRVFHSDLNIVSPHITEDQRIILLSQFSSMQTRSDYSTISQELERIGLENGLQLRGSILW